MQATATVARMSRRFRRFALAGLAVLLLISAPWLWTTGAALGHTHDEASAPTADVVIVLGTEVGSPRLTGRLTTAATLVATGKARAILVSGDGGGDSGDEVTAMAGQLTGPLGVDPARVVADPHGLDTYDSCLRAKEVYGVSRALIVTQGYHLSRAVTLCRSLGLDVSGVRARCDDCGLQLLVSKSVRDYFASGKAAWDAVRRRPPVVSSPANPSLSDAVRAS